MARIVLVSILAFPFVAHISSVRLGQTAAFETASKTTYSFYGPHPSWLNPVTIPSTTFPTFIRLSWSMETMGVPTSKPSSRSSSIKLAVTATTAPEEQTKDYILADPEQQIEVRAANSMLGILADFQPMMVEPQQGISACIAGFILSILAHFPPIMLNPQQPFKNRSTDYISVVWPTDPNRPIYDNVFDIDTTDYCDDPFCRPTPSCDMDHCYPCWCDKKLCEVKTGRRRY